MAEGSRRMRSWLGACTTSRARKSKSGLKLFAALCTSAQNSCRAPAACLSEHSATSPCCAAHGVKHSLQLAAQPDRPLRLAGQFLQQKWLVRTRDDDADVLLALVCAAGVLVQEQPLVEQQRVDGCDVAQAPQLAADVQQRVCVVPLLRQANVLVKNARAENKLRATAVQTLQKKGARTW